MADKSKRKNHPDATTSSKLKNQAMRRTRRRAKLEGGNNGSN